MEIGKRALPKMPLGSNIMIKIYWHVSWGKKTKCLEKNRHEKERENGKLQGKNIRDIYDRENNALLILKTIKIRFQNSLI